MEVVICYGPLPWFHDELGDEPAEYLLDAVHHRDEARKRIRLVAPGQDVDPLPEPEPPRRLAAESQDYASVTEHAITNFVGLMRDIDPEQLFLHNPPAAIHAQLARLYDIDVRHFHYPTFTRETLIAFRDGFADHLVGQRAVRERVLAALYPLTTGRRSKPVVLMFYGPSGVGKTETAQFVNGLLGGELMRKQFSMFQSEKFASYVFGGTHSEPSFARDLLDRDSGVILIDEFDKANAVFHSAFYELFDEGVFEDRNYRVRLGPALVICTSNYRSEDEIGRAIGEALRSRFDALISFDALSRSEIEDVVRRLVEHRASQLSEDEVARLDIGATTETLRVAVGAIGNVRQVGKIVDEAMSVLLVRALLADGDGHSPVRADSGPVDHDSADDGAR